VAADWLNVVYVSSLARGGPVSHLRVLAPAMARTGASVRVVCLDEAVAESFRAAGVDADAAPLRDKWDLRGAAVVWPLLDGADVVHTQDRRAGLLVRPAARARGSLVLHTYHGLPEEIAVRLGRDGQVPAPPGASAARLAWLLHGYLRIEALLARFGFVVAPSRAMAAYLAAHGLPRDRIHVVQNGIDLPSRPRRRGNSGKQLVVGTAATLEYPKGVDVLLGAARELGDAVSVEIFGDGSRRPQLEREADRRRLNARFHGHVDGLAERLRALDVFVLPSRAENFPVAALEAMAAGLPVVATRVGGVPELVVDGETGILVEPDDPAAMAAAIAGLAGDAGRRAALGQAGRRRVEALFSADRMAERMRALYESLR
jgi:glycosyltransferase involved in cell wall biosynthesis